MKVVWKFPFDLDDNVEIVMPEGAEILTVQTQDVWPSMVPQPTIWALVDPDAPLVQREFHVVGTGNPAPDGANIYWGTWQNHGFVWHLFEVEP